MILPTFYHKRSKSIIRVDGHDGTSVTKMLEFPFCFP